jgi:hypothetical protein
VIFILNAQLWCVCHEPIGGWSNIFGWFLFLQHVEMCKVKVKLSLCFLFNWAPRHEGVLGEWRYSSMHSLTSALDGGEWSASRPGRFPPRDRAPGTHWIGGWVGPRAGLDAVSKRNVPTLCRESNPDHPIVQSIVSCYTDWAMWRCVLRMNFMEPRSW